MKIQRDLVWLRQSHLTMKILHKLRVLQKSLANSFQIRSTEEFIFSMIKWLIWYSQTGLQTPWKLWILTNWIRISWWKIISTGSQQTTTTHRKQMTQSSRSTLRTRCCQLSLREGSFTPMSYKHIGWISACLSTTYRAWLCTFSTCGKRWSTRQKLNKKMR